MRMLMQVSFPVEVFNNAVKDGSVGAKMHRILGHLKPEATYFTDIHGQRSALMVVDLAKASDIPAAVEPLFLLFDARVEIHPVMTPEDLGAAGLEALGNVWG